jgi:hypothetical protein
VRKVINRLAVMSLIGLPIVGLGVPAGASTRPNVRVVSITSAAQPQGSTPKVKIVGNGASAVYSPNAIDAQEDTSGGNCTDFTSFKLTNKGTANANITIDGQTFFTLPAGDKAGICTDGGSAGTQLTFGLSNKKNTKSYPGTLLVTYTS